ncbi:hypothetical protein FDUTEX481_04918 [Tolypothrix sp. PCC 7601]|nr:hypothetical protein FDUTEX481_04918 [Tolypothrix sp. PCC 7601]
MGVRAKTLHKSGFHIKLTQVVIISPLVSYPAGSPLGILVE